MLISGIVAYSNEEKIRRLGVPEEMIAAHGAVSEEIAREMAQRVKMHTGATYGIATTGIAGPTGGTAEKPVGTAFVAVALKDEQPTRCEKVFFPSDRETFKDLVALYAFDLLRRHLR